MKSRITIALGLIGAVLLQAGIAQGAGRWSQERANQWYQGLPWLVGCNFSPSNAINQLEMWQADSFDPKTIERELAWAQQLGFTSVRVFLHHIPFQQDAQGFLARIEQFLQIAERHNIGVMFVLFDSCWDPFPKPGKQRDPRPHVHNSGWVQCPGLDVLTDPARHDELEGYVKGVLTRFRADKRVHVWDLFNEPDNRNDSSYGRLEPANKHDLAFALLKKAYAWARQCDPTQPVTSGVWHGDWNKPETLSPMFQFMLNESDVISFHCYAKPEETKERVEALQRYNRPILCTEYMARPAGSTFENTLPYFKTQRVAAYNWGFVAGKTQTNYPWDSWKKTYTAEPPLWFHDIFRPDGSVYDAKEVELIKRTTGKGQ